MNKKFFLIFILLENAFNQPFGGDESLPTIREICKVGDINYQQFQKIDSVENFLKTIDYDLKKEKNKTSDSYLETLLVEGDLTKETNPSEKNLFKMTDKYIFNKGVLILSIFWLCLIISLILGKCFFSQRKSPTSLFSKQYINMGQIVFIIIFILSCIPLFCSTNFKKAFNGSSCALVRFFQEVKFGNSTYNEGRNFFEKYTWLGLLNIDNILLDIQNFFNNTGINRKLVFDDIGEIEKNISNFGQQISNLEKFVKNSSINFYNRKMQPLYISEFNNIDKDGTKINKIYEDYQYPLEKIFRYMLNINDTTTLFERKNLDYKKNMEGVYNNSNTYSKLITQKSINITHNVQFLHEKAFNNVYDYFQYSHIFIIIMSSFLSFCMFIYYRRRTYCFKIIMHFGWNICMLIIIISFVVSYFLLSLGTTFSHLIYIIHEKVLKVKTNKFFDTCLNKNGNLLGLMQIDQIRTFAELNDFYHLIMRQNKKIEIVENSIVIKDYLDDIKKLKEDISLTTDESFVFIDINHLLNRLSEITGDKWVSNRFSCTKYRYLGKNIMISLNRENKNITDYCLTIQDKYNEEELKVIYKNKDEDKIYEIVTIVMNLNSYYEQNKNILEKIENSLIQIEEIHKLIINIINEKSKSINDLVNLYLSLFPEITDKESVSDFFNCEILKESLIAYYDLNYNYVYFYCRIFGMISLVIGLLTFVGMLLIINSIQWIDYEEYRQISMSHLNEEEEELHEIIEETDEDYDNSFEDNNS